MSRVPDDHFLLVADTSVLLNLSVLNKLDLFAAVGFEPHVPNHVAAEIRSAVNRRRLEHAVGNGLLRELEITEFAEMARYAKLRARFGDGEAAALAVALSRRWAIAIDEVGPVRRLVVDELGEARLVTTAKLLTMAVERSIIRLSEIAKLREILARNRFVMGPLPMEQRRR